MLCLFKRLEVSAQEHNGHFKYVASYVYICFHLQETQGHVLHPTAPRDSYGGGGGGGGGGAEAPE